MLLLLFLIIVGIGSLTANKFCERLNLNPLIGVLLAIMWGILLGQIYNNLVGG